MIQKKTLADEVAERLQLQIQQGDFKVGDKLPTEPMLMKSFGVGRSSIREAIKILVNLGLLDVQQGVGTFVLSREPARESLELRLKRAAIKDLDEVRKLLELKIAEKAALLHSPLDIQKMRDCLDKRALAAKAGDITATITADIDFHLGLATASGNEILLDLYKAAALHMAAWFKKVHLDTSAFLRTQHLHEELLSFVENGDGKSAWDKAVQIIDSD